MPHGITQCYLPPGRGAIPALTATEAGTRLSDPGGMQGWVDLRVRVTCASAVRRRRAALAYVQIWCHAIHKTGSTQHITTPPEWDRATAIWNMHRNFAKIGRVVAKIWSRKDKYTHTQTHTHNSLLRSLIGGGVMLIADMVNTAAVCYAVVVGPINASSIDTCPRCARYGMLTRLQ